MLLHHKQYLDISKQKFGLNSILYMLDAVILGLLDISIMIYMRFVFLTFLELFPRYICRGNKNCLRTKKTEFAQM